jgi:hypothetical protein
MFDQLLDFVKLSRLTVSTARRVLTAQITGAGDAGDDAAAETLSSVEVVQPLGLLAYPTLGATTEALIARIGDTAVALGLIDKGGAAQAVEAGEVRLYGPGSQNATAVVRIRADGSIEITSKSGLNVTATAPAAGVVILQNGSQAFVRGNDFSTALNAGLDAMKVLFTAIGVFATAVGTFATAVGTALPPVATAAGTLNTAAVALNIAVTTCNAAIDVLKASSSAWLSTKVLGQ